MKKEIGPIPVIKNRWTHRVVGVVIDRDLALKAVAEGRGLRRNPLVAASVARKGGA